MSITPLAAWLAIGIVFSRSNILRHLLPEPKFSRQSPAERFEKPVVAFGALGAGGGGLGSFRQGYGRAAVADAS